MFNRGGKKRDLREIISKASNFKERAKFPSRIKTIVSRKFLRISKAISEQKNSHVTDGRVCYSQPRPQGFSLKKWVGREKALASAGHVHSLNIPEKLIYMQPAGFALTDGNNNGK